MVLKILNINITKEKLDNMNNELIDVNIYKINNIDFIELEQIKFNNCLYSILTEEESNDTVLVKKLDGENLLDVDNETYYKIINLYVTKVQHDLI